MLEIFVSVPVTVTVVCGLAKSGLTEVMAIKTGAPLACRGAPALAAAPLRFRPDRARADAAIAVAALLVSSGRGMAEMLLRPGGCGE